MSVSPFVGLFVKDRTGVDKAVVESLSSNEKVVIALLQPGFGYW